MVHTRSVRAGNSSLPLGQGQPPNNLPPLIPPQLTPQLPPQRLARNNHGDPLINLLNPAQQPPSPQQNPQPVQHALAISESQGQSHIAPAQQPLPGDVTRRLDSLEKLVAKHRGAPPPHHATDSIPHPLNTNITLEPYPAGFKIPQLETYDGTKDPDDHLHAFYSCMQAQNASDALMCKIFPSTLRGNARTWYYSLPPRSISSYTEMTSAFATKFSSRRLIRKTTSELMRVKQRDEESLKNYMSRFNDAVLEVNSFDQTVGIVAVIAGLKHDRFRDSLIKHSATTFSEVNDRSLKFITVEEYALAQNPPPSKNQNPKWREDNLSQKRMRMAQNRGSMPTSTSRFGRPNSTPPQQSAGKPPINWTPFNLPRSQIFMQIKNKMDLRRPDPMKTAAATRNHTRYCDFHQDHGHTTEQCNSLRSELESLAQKGMLNEYVQRAAQPRFVREQGPQPQGARNPPNRQGVGYQQNPPPLPPPARIIHMITGGLEAVVTPHNNPLVTSVMINNYEVQRVLVDTGSAPDIMYFHYFESLGLDPALLQKYDGPIYGFNNQPVPVEGILTLHVAFGSGRTYVTPSVRFLVVKMASSFNIVIGRPTLTEIRAVVSQSHLCMKFPTPMGIATLRGNQEVARHCYITSVTQPMKGKAQTPEAIPQQIPDNQQVMGVEIVDNRPEDETRAAPVEDVEEVLIDDRDPSRKTQIGTRLNTEERAELIAFLRANNDVFTWTSADMPGIPNSVSQHKLSTNPLKKPVAQKRRLFGGERLQAIKEEVEKLLQAGFVRKVDYCEWVANPVLVKKANGKWRMCINYTNLNQACPKDCYPMPSIDKLVEATLGNKRLSLLDAYSRYHQVPMAPEDEEKTSFYAGDEIYCYVMMSFGLKNASATYQNRMRLNPAKCIFGVEFGKFLGFMVSRRGIEVNPEKIRAIAKMEPPKSVKDIQRLTGRVAALHRFISKSANKLIKWVVELGEFEITFQQRSAIRTQALADFIVKCTPCPPTPDPKPNDWTLYVDGASSNKGSRAGALLIGPDGYRSEHALKFNFDAINNMAEYEALLLGLQLALELKINTIQVYSDSQLVVNQINSICKVVDPVMVKYVALVAELKCKFQKFYLSKIPRTENEQADSLSKFAFDSSLSSRSVFVEVLDEPSFTKPRMMEISTNPDTPSWTDSIISFLRKGVVPVDKQEAMKLRKKASRYTLIDGVLYNRSFSLPLLRCLNPYEAEYALREVHEGVCGSHVGARTLAHKVLRQGYYWPNMYKDATHFVQKCPRCQFFAHLTHQPAEELTNLVAPWPFAQWGMDLLGPFVKGVGGVTHLIVGVDYFTKWVEARPLSSRTSKKVEDFVFSSIICRYGIPNQIVVDNGTQFNFSSFRDFCSGYGIKLQFTSVYHPESNGMVESINKCILEGIRPRLEQHKAKWADELNNVLWAYRTTSQTATDKQKLANFYNKRVRPRTFKIGDLVLRKAGLTGFETRFGKLTPNWEGPYTVAEVPHPGAYVLQDAEGKRVPRVWNVNNLKKFYP
ncbi:hypothetical protein SLEP1_g35111 [Rubroshorea leprosula]|uniref:Uncharacterized protein n=1 Tax=Rubroshorea leprosula TaxID=152421 RepID=A0AAV5KM76_9ROSI|nr:hypothetical protein SLEP1_g35111 [Rubroshorea leprosula]